MTKKVEQNQWNFMVGSKVSRKTIKAVCKIIFEAFKKIIYKVRRVVGCM